MIKKRILSIILSVLMIFTMLPANIFTATAADTEGEASTVATDYTVEDVNNNVTETVKGNKNPPTGTIPTGSHWEGPEIVEIPAGEKGVCGKIEHKEHTESCYTENTYVKYVNDDGCKHWTTDGRYHSSECVTITTTQVKCDARFHILCGCSGESGGYMKTETTYTIDKCNHTHSKDMTGTTKCYNYSSCPAKNDTLGNSAYTHTHEEPTCYKYEWTLKWNAYTVEFAVIGSTWEDGTSSKITQTVEHGKSVDVPVVKVGTNQSLVWTPAIDKDATSITISPANTEHGAKLAYIATVTQDKVYTVTYKVDGEIYVIDGKEQVYNVNATKGEKVPSVVAPDKADYVFAGWTNASQIDKVPTGNLVLEAQWEADLNNNDKADNDGEIATVTVEVTNGTATLASGHEKVKVSYNETTSNYVVVYDSVGGNYGVTLTATANNGETTNVAYYLDKELANTDNGKVGTTFNVNADTTVTITFSKEEFNLKPLAEGKNYEIVINGFDNTLKADGLKNYVLDAVLGAGTYNPDHYKVEMLASYGILGEHYLDVTGYTLGTISIPASWFVDQLKVDGKTENKFKITKLAASNVSGINLYHEGVVVIASDSRQSITANDITLDPKDYNENTLNDVANAIKGKVKVKGNDIDDKYVTVTLEPADQALTTEKQDYTATVTIKDNPDYIVGEGVTATFTITADISTYTVTWVADGVTVGTETVAYGGTATKTPAVPEKEGHTGKWNKEVGTVTGDVTIEAVYTVIPYTIEWYVDDVLYDSATLNYGSALTQIAEPTKEGHTFSGWSAIPATMPVDGVRVDGTFTVNTYYVTWIVQGEEETKGYKYNTPVTKENPVAPDGYGFGGWYDEAGNRVTLPFVMPADDDGIRLEAKFFKAAAMIIDTEDNVKLYETFAGAMDAAQASDTIVLLDDVLCYGEIAIAKSITIDGNGFSFVADENYGSWYTTNQWGIKNYKVYPLAIKSDNVTLFNVTIDCNKLGKGLDILGYDNIVLDNVTVKNETGNAININGANVILRNKVTSNNIIGGGKNYSIVAESGVVLDVRTVAFQGTPDYSNTDMDNAFATDGTSYWSIKKLDANGDLAGYANSLSRLSNGYGYQLLEDMTATSNVTLLNAGHMGTLDLNGYTLTVDSGYTLTVNGVLNVNNAGAIKGQVVLGTEAAQIVAPAGWTNIENGTDSYKVIYHNGAYCLGSEITFVYNNGEADKVITVPAGESFEAPVPTWAAHHFTGWDTKVNLTPTEDAIYTAQWVDDRNGNKVDDNTETIDISKIGDGNFTVQNAIDLGNGKYVFDSTNPYITIVATPVVENGISKSYVYSVAGIGSSALHYGDGFTATETVAVALGDVIAIEFKDVPVIKTESDVVVDYNFFTQEIPYDDIYNAVIAEPEIMTTPSTEVKYEYFARPAMTHIVSIDSLDLDSSIKTILETLGITEFKFDMPALWLPLDAQIEKSVDLNTAVSTYLTKERINALYDIFNAAYNAAYDAYIAEHGNSIVDKGLAVAAGTKAGGEAVKADIADIYDAVYAAAKYYGAHNFGYNPNGADTVDEIIRITYTNAAMSWAAETTVTLRDPREAAFVEGDDLELVYRDYTDEDILSNFVIVDKDGNVIDGELYSIQLSDPYTFEGKNVSETAYELLIIFDGNAGYKAAEKTVNVTIKKATASIDLPNVNITYGDGYDPTPSVTLGNQYGESQEVVDSLVEIIIGLDVDELEITADGKLDGLATHIQFILPQDDTLASIFKLIGLDVYGEGVTLSLDELQGYLDQINDLLAEYDSSNGTMNTIASVLESVTGLVDVSNIEITFGGSYPTDIGVYLYGAVSTSGNYETAYDIGYIIIKPDTTKVYLDWNYTDENGIFTWELLQHINLGATAFDDEAFTTVNSAATDKVVNLFLGIDEEGNVVFTSDATTLGNGAYTEIAFIYDFGNEFFYAEPIVRAFLIVPNVLDVEIVDKNGEAKDNYEYEFDNTGKEHNITVDGELVDAEITYIGLQTNGKTYNSTIAPTQAGAYVAYVTYLAYNEAGELTGVGADVVTITIEPAKSTIDVTGGNVKYDGQGHTVTVDSGSKADSNLNVDYTLISGTVNLKGSVSEIGADALYGNVNIDFPRWLDARLATYEAFNEGVSPAYLIEFITAYRDELIAKIAASDADTAAQLDAYIDELLAVLAKLPSDITLTFKDNITYTMPGYYFYYGIVTDSDHYPSTDTGLLVIEKLDLEFDLENTTLPYNGKEQFVTENNPLGTDYVTIITDDKNNVANIILDADLMYVIGLLEEVLGKKLPTSVELSDIYNAVSVEKLIAAINTVLGKIETIDNLPEVAVDLIDWIKNQIATLPANGTVVVNGKLPVNVGKYNVYAFTYSEIYKSVADGATLVIAPIYVVVDDIENSKIYGETDPELKANVTYYSYKTVNGQVVKVAITELSDDIKLAYYVEREAGEDVGDYAMSVQNATIIDSDNYVLEVVEDDTVFTINPAQVTITVNNQNKTYGDADPELTYDINTTLGKVTAEELGVTISRVPGEDVGTYNITANYNASNNYVVTVVDGTLTITTAKITVTMKDVTKVYGEEDPNFGYTYETGYDGEFMLVVPQTRVEGEDVGTYEIKPDAYVFFNDNFEVEVIAGTLTITAKEITVADVELVGSLIYNATKQTQGITVTNGITYEVTGNTGADAGDYTLTVKGTGNYTGTVTLDWAIAKAKVSVIMPNVSKTYGDADPSFMHTIEGWMEDGSMMAVTPSRDEGEDVGTYTVTGTATTIFLDNNYEITVVPGTLTINPAKVVITVDSANKTYGDADPKFNYTVDVTEGKVTAEELGVTISRIPSENVGTYNITANYNASNNYVVTVVDGTFTITQRPATIKVDSQSMVAGNKIPELTATETGVVDGDTLDYELKVDGTTITAILGNNPNYDVTVVDGTLTVSKAVAQNVNTGVYYAELSKAIEEASDNDTIILIANIDIADVKVDTLDGRYNTLFRVAGKTVTIDLNGKSITGEYSGNSMLVGVFSTENNGHLTLKDSTANEYGIGNSAVNISANSTVYSLIANYDPTSTIVIESGNHLLDKAGDSLVYSGGNEGILVKGGYFELGNVGTGSNGMPWIFNVLGRNDAHTTVIGGTYNAPIHQQYWAAEVYIPYQYAVVDNGNDTWTVVPAVCYIEEIDGEKVGYATLADAIAAVENGETIHFLKDIDEDVTIKQTKGLSFTIDGDDHKYTGSMTIDGGNRSNGAETLTVTDIDFVAADQLQSSISTKKSTFAHNITVDDCTFTGISAGENTAYGMVLRHAYNITVKNTTGTGLLDIVYANTAVTGFTAENVTVTDSVNGFYMTYGSDVKFDKVNLVVSNIGIYLTNNNGTTTATITNSTINAAKPIVVNEVANKTYTLVLDGYNKFTTDGIWLNVVDSDPVNTGKIKVVMNDGHTEEGTSGLVAVNVNTNTYYNTLAYAVSDAANGNKVKALADVVENVTVNNNITLDLNQKTITGNLTVNGDLVIVDEDQNGTVEAGRVIGELTVNDGGSLELHAGTYDRDVAKECANGYGSAANAVAENTWTVLSGVVCYNVQTGISYFDVSDALNEAAGKNQTVKMLVDVLTASDKGYEALVMVPQGVTFDLNGHYFKTENIFSFGHVIDNTAADEKLAGTYLYGLTVTETIDGKGGIVITNDRTKAFVQLQENNAYMPLYDAANGCYRFYGYSIAMLAYETPTSASVTFRYIIRFTNNEYAYILMSDTANSGLTVEANIQWTDMSSASMDYVLKDETVYEYADAAYNQVVSGEKTHDKVNKTIEVTMFGLDTLNSGDIMTSKLTVASETGFSFTKIVGNTEADIYVRS